MKARQRILKNRVFQYIGIMLIAGVFGTAYWYFSARAGFNTSSSEQETLNTGLTSGLVGYWPFDGNDTTGIVIPDVQSYWPLDEGSGTTARDAASNTNTGTLQGSPAWTTSGKFLNAVTFDGTNDEITTTTQYVNPQTFSISAWIKTSTASGKKIVGFENAQTGTTSSQFDRHITMGTDGKIRFGIYNAGFYEISSSGTYANGSWHHVVGTFNGSTSTLYIDGVSQGTSSPGGAENYNGYWRIGGYACGAGAWTNCSNGYFSGDIDDVRIYGRALAAPEVTALYGMATPTAYDRSGNGNNGLLFGGAKAIAGKSGQGLSFDGASQTVLVTDSPFDLTDMTVSAWARTTSTSRGSIITKGTTADYQYALEVNKTTNKASFTTWQSGSSSDYLSVSGATTVNDGNWHYISGTISGTTISIYVDGVLDGTSSTTTGTRDTSGAASLVIGGRVDAANFFSGSIDEPRIYNRALSVAEITQLYQSGASDKINAVEARSDALTAGLTGYWRLDEGSGTTTADSSGNGNTFYFGGSPAWATGEIGGGVDFGTSDYLATLAPPTAATQYLTLSTWVYWQSTSQSAIILYNGSIGSNNGYGLLVSDGSGGAGNKITIVIAGVTYNVTGSTAVLPSNQWAHIVMTRDGTTWKLYLNGVQVPGTGTSNANTPTSSFIAGGGVDAILDEVRFYRRPLSAPEVAELYRETNPENPDSNLVGYWTFDGQDTYGTTTLDRSIKGNAGAFVNTPISSAGMVNQSFSFDGVSSYVSVPNNSAFDFGTNQDFTISAWVRTTQGMTSGKYYGILSKEDGIATRQGYNLVLHYSNTDARWYFNVWSGGVQYQVYGLSDIADGNWHHIVGMRSGSNIVTYQDGSYVDTQAGSSGSLSKSVPLDIGQKGGGGNLFNGKIDEVRIYNRTLSASEIQELYANSQERKNHINTAGLQKDPLTRGLAGHWRLDDGSGTSAIDSSVNGNTGTLTNGPTWTTGQINGAVNLDGADDYIAISDSATIRPLSGSISAWVNLDTLPTSTASVVSRWYDSGGYQGYRLVISSAGVPGVCIGQGDGTAGCASGTAISTGSWHHLVGTWVSGSGGVKIFIDGKLAGSGTSSSVSYTSTGIQLAIGRNISTWYLDGKIDDVRLYGRALNENDVDVLYRMEKSKDIEPNLVGYWSFNGSDIGGASGAVAFDLSGKNNQGTLTNGPAVTSGKSGQGLSFDGSNDYVTMGNNAVGPDIGSVSAVTVSAWMRPSAYPAASSYKRIFNSVIDTVSTGVLLGLYNGANVIVGGRSSNADGFQSATATAPSLDEWHLLTGILDFANDRIYVYLDGTLQTNQSVTFASSTYTHGTPTSADYVGCTGGSTDYFSGKIDEVRIYNRALSADEVKSLYDRAR